MELGKQQDAGEPRDLQPDRSGFESGLPRLLGAGSEEPAFTFPGLMSPPLLQAHFSHLISAFTGFLDSAERPCARFPVLLCPLYHDSSSDSFLR